ncbi:MAG: MATE family efflux transporter, partial [Pseudomonadota bacterium]
MVKTTGTDFTQGPIMRHVTVMSFTSSIGIMAIYLVDLLDIFFVSLLGQAEIAAAAGFASTLMFYVSAMNIGLSIAAGTLTAQYLGKHDRASARDVAAASMV